MNISVFGLGYVGTVCCACLAERGHQVVGVDKSEAKVNLVRTGHSPIVGDADRLVSAMVRAGRLTATADASEAVDRTDTSIVCVGTPSRPNGSLSLDAVENVTLEIGRAIRSKWRITPLWYALLYYPERLAMLLCPGLPRAAATCPSAWRSTPNFCAKEQRSPISIHRAKTIVGAVDKNTAAAVMSLYDGLPGPKIATSLEVAEFVKYVDNAWMRSRWCSQMR